MSEVPLCTGVWRERTHSTVQSYPRFLAAAAVRRRNNFQRFKPFDLKVTAIIWPFLSYVCHIRSTADLQHGPTAYRRGYRNLNYPITCIMRPAPCTLHPTPCTLHPAPCTLHPAPYTLHPTPCTLHPAPCARNPGTRNPRIASQPI